MAAAVLAGILWSPAQSNGGQTPSTSQPLRLSAYIERHVKLSPDEHARLLKGEPVTRLLEVDPSQEVSIFGAVWVNAPASRYVAAVNDIEQFEKGENFLVTKRISSPPRLEDFARSNLNRRMWRILRRARWDPAN